MIAFCIKTFERPKQLERLVKSIKKFYPKAKIYIADDSHEPGDIETTFPMPFDSGLSAGRNLLITKTKEPYLLFLDDDFVFTKHTKIQMFVDALEKNPDIGLVGGALDEKGIQHYEGTIALENNEVKTTRLSVNMHEFREVGLVFNFFLARRELFDSVRWDNDLKLAEHSDFFLRLSFTKWKVGYEPSVVVVHSPHKHGEYKKYRCRGKHFVNIFMKKRGIKKITNYNGEVYEL